MAIRQGIRPAPVRAGMVAVAVLAVAIGQQGANADLEADKQHNRSQLNATGADMHSSNRTVARATEQVQQARSQLPAAISAMQEAQGVAATARSNHDEALSALADATEDLHASRRHLSKVETDLDGMQEDVGNFARRAYQIGPFNELEVVLEAKSPSEFADRLSAIRNMSWSANSSVSRMASNRADAAHTQVRVRELKRIATARQETASARLETAQQAESHAVAAKQAVDALVAQEQQALARAESQRAAIKREYRRLEAEQARIQQEIAAAARRAERRARREAARRAAEQAAAERAAAARAAAERAAAEQRAAAARRSTSSRSSSSSSSSRSSSSSGSSGSSSRSSGSSSSRSSYSSGGSGGAWVFPVPGAAIGGEAGMRFHPILKYNRCHTGADIGAGSGATIRAAASGRVISAGWNGGYGNFTVISHGGGVTSGYAHQTRIIVGSGQWVNQGQTIGYVGSTGLSTGPHLHFEARVNGVPYNPRGWLGTGSRSPVC